MSAQQISEKRILLKTSELSCFFELETGFLRRVIVDGCEVVRAIYGAVRDRNWNTVLPKIVVDQIETSDEHFRLGFEVECSSGEIAFSWQGTIEALAGTLTFGFAGEAKSTFKKNRIGLCLLHPVHECAGKPCRVRTGDESWSDAEFPLFISPHQPFKGLGALSWKPRPDLEATITFAGEVFETEDQRNWTDASFKTYGTPLEKPFPEEIVSGTQVHQSITLKVDRLFRPPTISKTSDHGAIIVPTSEEKAFPWIGLCASSYRSPLTEVERVRLAALNLNHLRVDVRFDDPNWRESLEMVTADAIAIGASLQAALFLSGKEELHAFASVVNRRLLQGCLIFHIQESSDEYWLELASELLPQSTIIGGTNAYFAELNRRRPVTRFPAAFSINPQVHAFDDLSLIENLEAQPETIHSARQFCAFDLYISPVTLRPRSNPNSTAHSIEPFDRLPSSVDPRQRTLFGAAWTIGSLARLLPVPGIKSLTYYETIGWKGLMEGADGNPLPDRFESKPGEIFPVYHIFHALAEADAFFPVANPLPDQMAALAFQKNGAVHILLANLQSEPTIARLQLPAREVAVQVLTEKNLATGRQGRLPDAETLSLQQGEAVFPLPSYSVGFVRCI